MGLPICENDKCLSAQFLVVFGVKISDISSAK